MQLQTVVSWLPDPRGWGMFAALAGRARRDLQAQRVVIDRSSSSFGGWAATPQRFAGLGGLLAGQQRALASAVSDLVDERSNLLPGAMNAFYDRMKRGEA